jgi:hypothetical protein
MAGRDSSRPVQLPERSVRHGASLTGRHVDFYLSEDDRELIRTSQRELFLALVFASGEVRIRIADAIAYRGHVEWVNRDQIEVNDIAAAFSFIVKNGEVTGLFSSSELNRTPDWRLEASQVESICRLLPVATDYKLY